MNKKTILIIGVITSFVLGFYINTLLAKQINKEKTQSNVKIKNQKEGSMQLGAFSMSLSVKDINASKEFYESIGFQVFAGSLKQNYLIMKNGNALIGIFQGMFEGNILTFNPGWDENAKNLDNFDDIREIQKHIKSKGIKVYPEADETTQGPASFMLTDPDGNVILFDQHR